MHCVVAHQPVTCYWFIYVYTFHLGVLKNKKNPRKTRIGHTSPTHPPIHFFFKFWKHVQQQKNTENTKNTTFSKKKRIRVGAWPIHQLPSFSWIFFNLTQPLSLTLLQWNRPFPLKSSSSDLQFPILAVSDNQVIFIDWEVCVAAAIHTSQRMIMTNTSGIA